MKALSFLPNGEFLIELTIQLSCLKSSLEEYTQMPNKTILFQS